MSLLGWDNTAVYRFFHLNRHIIMIATFWAAFIGTGNVLSMEGYSQDVYLCVGFVAAVFATLVMSLFFGDHKRAFPHLYK